MNLPTFLFLTLTTLAVCIHQQPFDCSTHNATANLQSLAPPGAICLSYLKKNPGAFEVCKTHICYLFVQQAPFIQMNTTIFSEDPEAEVLQTPFRCSIDERRNHHPSLQGIAFEVLERTSAREHYCAWVGSSSGCAFNTLVDFIDVMAEQDYMFAITGISLDTQQRRCRNTPSAPLINNRMTIIGQRNVGDASSINPLSQLTKPFKWQSWAILCATLLLFAAVAIGVALRFHLPRGRSIVTACLICFGDSDDALPKENQIYDNEFDSVSSLNMMLPEQQMYSNSPISLAERTSSYSEVIERQQSNLHKYSLALTLFRVGLLAFFAIFALFYEVAVVNFLFQQQSQVLKRDIRSLSRQDLQSYAVPKFCALEDTFISLVDPFGMKNVREDVPWHRCSNGAECIRQTADHNNNISFTVTFEVSGRYLIDRFSNCDDLTLFGTEDIPHEFNGGWLYNAAVNDTIRRQIDREILFLRSQGTIRSIVDAEVPLGCETGTSSIDPLIILVPVGIFVLPPLVLSVLLLIFWGKGIRPSRDPRLSEKRRAGEVMGLWRGGKSMNDTDEKSSNVLTDI